MLSFLRGSNPVRSNTATQNPVYYEDGSSYQRFHGAGSAYCIEHKIPNNKSFFNPPLHLHLWQTEDFLTKKGTGIWHQPTASPSERRVVKKAGDPPIHLAAGKFHRFENPSPDEELVVDIRLDPESNGSVMEERFFRNFFGYLEDCRKQKVEPSIFQLELFLYSVDGPLAIPIPGPDSVKWWVSRGVMVLLGVVVGKWLLGYQMSYPEYYRENN